MKIIRKLVISTALHLTYLSGASLAALGGGEHMDYSDLSADQILEELKKEGEICPRLNAQLPALAMRAVQSLNRTHPPLPYEDVFKVEQILWHARKRYPHAIVFSQNHPAALLNLAAATLNGHGAHLGLGVTDSAEQLAEVIKSHFWMESHGMEISYTLFAQATYGMVGYLLYQGVSDPRMAMIVDICQWLAPHEPLYKREAAAIKQLENPPKDETQRQERARSSRDSIRQRLQNGGLTLSFLNFMADHSGDETLRRDTNSDHPTPTDITLACSIFDPLDESGLKSLYGHLNRTAKRPMILTEEQFTRTATALRDALPSIPTIVRPHPDQYQNWLDMLNETAGGVEDEVAGN